MFHKKSLKTFERVGPKLSLELVFYNNQLTFGLTFSMVFEMRSDFVKR